MAAIFATASSGSHTKKNTPKQTQIKTMKSKIILLALSAAASFTPGFSAGQIAETQRATKQPGPSFTTVDDFPSFLPGATSMAFSSGRLFAAGSAVDGSGFRHGLIKMTTD